MNPTNDNEVWRGGAGVACFVNGENDAPRQVALESRAKTVCTN